MYLIPRLCSGQDTFQEVAEEWGIVHYHHNQNYVGVGGGVAVFDYNNDGFLDLYFTGGWSQDELFKNNGNGTFTRVGRYAGLTNTKFFNTKGVVTGDINNDGYRDVFVVTESNYRNLLFLNNQDGTFSEIGGIYENRWSMGGVFADFNLDGWLDLYIVQYIRKGQLLLDDEMNVIGFDHACYANNLYLNEGNLSFSILDSTGAEDKGCGLAAVATDINNDHLPDLLIANDFGEWNLPNTCFINDYPSLGFHEEGAALGLDAKIYGMGIAVGDPNRDGLLDYYLTNIGPNILFENQGDGMFLDVAEERGVLNDSSGQKYTSGWGTAFFDYDHDGFEDLFVSNGYLQAVALIGNEFEQSDKLYRNVGDGLFEDVSEAEGVADRNIAKGMAVGDLDNDGDLEIIVTAAGDNATTGNVLVYENRLSNENNWLKVKLMGNTVNPDGFGAKIKAFRGDITWIREIAGGSSHASQNSSLAHFGFGELNVLDSLQVIWPGGKTQVFEQVGTDRMLLIEEDKDTYFVAGCMDTSAENFDAEATFDYGCYSEVVGCLDQEATNFDIHANVNSGNCMYDPVEEPLGVQQPGEPFIYPNPLHETATIEFTNPEGVLVHVEVLTLSGKVFYQKTTRQNAVVLTRDNFAPGVYVVVISGPTTRNTIRLMVD